MALSAICSFRQLKRFVFLFEGFCAKHVQSDQVLDLD
jgi:hypothetical protein